MSIAIAQTEIGAGFPLDPRMAQRFVPHARAALQAIFAMSECNIVSGDLEKMMNGDERLCDGQSCQSSM